MGPSFSPVGIGARWQQLGPLPPARRAAHAGQSWAAQFVHRGAVAGISLVHVQ
jgi:hypothetical protein